jgi:hypothetical protein
LPQYWAFATNASSRRSSKLAPSAVILNSGER